MLTTRCEQGFTPAAWDFWLVYNPLGKVLLVIFLIICHFVVVTILITVLTNSFMAVASNANEEHQFLFAINTISMVKNDALFSYVAPGNIIAWMVTPLSYVMPLREYVRLNRTIIKVTHFPLLFCIFIYEKYVLASHIYEPTDLVENPGRNRGRFISFADPALRASLFSPHARTREESVAGHQKEEALVEVFRRAPDASTLRQQRRQERRKSQTAIRNWMDQNDAEGEPLGHWPTIDTRRSGGSRYNIRRFRTVSDVRSAASDPADLMSNSGRPISGFGTYGGISPGGQPEDKAQDGDDELVTNDEDEDEVATEDPRAAASRGGDDEDDYFTTPVATRFGTLAPSSLTSAQSSKLNSSPISPRTAQTRRQGLHSRTLSTNTILYAPQDLRMGVPATESESEAQLVGRRSRPRSSRHTPAVTPAATRARSPRRPVYVHPGPSRPRPIPAKGGLDPPPLLSAPNPRMRVLSSIDADLNSDIVGTGIDPSGDFHGVPASFATQMAWATGQLKGLNRNSQERESLDRMSRLVLARMKTLEEGFADVVKEMRTMRSVTATAQNSGDDGSLPKSGTITIEVHSDDIRKLNRKGGASKSRPTTSRREAERPVPVVMTPARQRSGYKDKGKGKEVVAPASDSDDEREREQKERDMEGHYLRRRRSSF